MCELVDLVCRLEPESPRHPLRLIEARIPMKGGVTLSKTRNTASPKSCPFKTRRKAVQLHFGPKFPLRTSNHRIRIGSSVIDHAIMNAKPPCQQSRAARQTGRVRRMNVIEHHRRLRELIDIGRGISVISVATQVVRPQSINVYIQDSQRAPTDLLVRPT